LRLALHVGGKSICVKICAATGFGLEGSQGSLAAQRRSLPFRLQHEQQGNSQIPGWV
jgi:hypothetical protein